MRKSVKLPETIKRQNILAFKVSDNEQNKIKEFCKQNRVTQSSLIRFALKKIMPNF